MYQSSFGLRVDPSMLTVNGRILAPPNVHYRVNPTKEHQILPNRGIAPRVHSINLVGTNFNHVGSWNFNNVMFITAANIGTWGCLHFTLSRHDQISEMLPKILEDFTGVLKKCGMNTGFRHPTFECQLSPRDAENESIIKKALRYFWSKNPRPKILLVIIPNQNKATYAKIKYFGDTQAGIHTVCVVNNNRKFGKLGNVQYYANVAMKVSIYCSSPNGIVR